MKKIDPKYINVPNVNFSSEYDEENESKYKEQRLERGFDDSETWNLDYTISCFILPRLKQFKVLNNTHPAMITLEEWNEILDKMIFALQYRIEIDDIDVSTDSPRMEEQHNEGLQLFAKWFDYLWW